MKKYLPIILIALLLNNTYGVEGEGKAKPNFLIIIADDCTFRDISCYGGQASTPHIDKLAHQGIKFTQCFQAAPMCSPTRHNIYTGLYPLKTGAYPNHTFAKPGTKSVVHHLKPLGYRVALSGKRHIAPKTVFPFEYLPGNKNPAFKQVEEFIIDSSTKQQPFCLFLCSNEPHDPWTKGDPSQYDPVKLKLPPNFVDTEVTRREYCKYLAEITYFDSQVGQALSLLDKHKLDDNTLVIVLSEQGSILPFAKWTCYDSGLQSAFIARWPGQIKAGSTSKALIEFNDILPTFIDAAGGKAITPIDGKSLLPILRGTETEHKKYVFGEMTTVGINNGSKHYGIRSIRSKQYKYIYNFTPEVKFQNVAMTKDFYHSWQKKAQTDKTAKNVLNRFELRPGEELYNVIKDPFEMNNLAGRNELQAVQQNLRTELLMWMNNCGDLGQQSELKARQHQTGNNRSKKK